MKKSKIIVPALGILAFSTAAAVTGTVAWFTASRTGTINNTAITAFNPETGLDIKLQNGTAGTTLDPAGKASAVSAAHALLRDGSVDISADAHKVYGSNLGEDGTLDSTTPYKLISDANYEAGTRTSDSKKYYYAHSYQALFSLKTTESSDNYALIYDNGDLDTSAAADSTIKKALRIGIRNNENDELMVIAPFRASTDDKYNYQASTVVDSDDFETRKSSLFVYSAGAYIAATTYDAGTTYYVRTSVTCENFVNSTTTATGSYADSIIYSNDDNASSVGGSVENVSAISGNKGYLGTITADAVITTTVFTWFEGCDPACNNDNVDGLALASKLTFRLVKIGA